MKAALELYMLHEQHNKSWAGYVQKGVESPKMDSLILDLLNRPCRCESVAEPRCYYTDFCIACEQKGDHWLDFEFKVEKMKLRATNIFFKNLFYIY